MLITKQLLQRAQALNFTLRFKRSMFEIMAGDDVIQKLGRYAAAVGLPKDPDMIHIAVLASDRLGGVYKCQKPAARNTVIQKY